MSVNFDTETAAFNATFIVDTSIAQPTLIFYSSEFWYPTGASFEITLDDGSILDPADFSLAYPSPNYASLQILEPTLSGRTVHLSLLANQAFHKSL